MSFWMPLSFSSKLSVKVSLVHLLRVSHGSANLESTLINVLAYLGPVDYLVFDNFTVYTFAIALMLISSRPPDSSIL